MGTVNVVRGTIIEFLVELRLERNSHGWHTFHSTRGIRTERKAVCCSIEYAIVSAENSYCIDHNGCIGNL